MPETSMGEHVSSISNCDNGQVNLGDNLTVTAYYNTSEYAPMINTDGILAPIMGIGLLYLAVNETGSSSTTSGTATGTATGVVSLTSNAAGSIMTVAARAGPALFAGAMGGMVALGFP